MRKRTTKLRLFYGDNMINELIECDCMDYMKTCKDKQFDLAIAMINIDK